MSVDQVDALDPRHSRALRAELPGIEQAFDEGLMRQHLQAALLGTDGYSIGRCARGHAVYEPGESCVVRYAIEVGDRAGRVVGHALVTVRLFPSPLSSRIHFESCLAPLGAAIRGREELAPFAAPAAVLEPLSMTVSLFPIDADLPTLVAATDAGRMLEILREALRTTDGRPVIPIQCRVEVAHYPRQHHCVLRYTLEGPRPSGEKAPGLTVFGKIAADDRGAVAAVAVAELRERILRGKGRPFTVPRSLGFVEALRLTLLEAIPGVPRISRLLRARLRNEPEANATPSLEDAIDWAARVAAALHGSGIALGPSRRLEDELIELRQARAGLERVSPGLAAGFSKWLETAIACAAMAEPWPACFSHGDFSPSQLIFSADQCGLIDFDTICQAEPALDLGHFLAYLRLSARKACDATSTDGTDATERVCARFVETYVDERSYGREERERLRARVRLYETVSLLRLVFHSWRKFKTARLELAVGLVQQRLPWLARATA